MFPIRDHNPSGRTPFVTWALIALNVVVFLSYWTSLPSDLALSRFFQTWGLVPGRIMAGQGYETLLTSMFLHGGWLHLAGNMWFLWLFGDNLEDEMGHLRYLGFYLLGGLAAAALQIASGPGSPLPMIGASGAIAGVMGGYLLLFPSVWFGLQLFSGAVTPTDAGGVAYWAHAGGFLAGLVLALPALMARGGRGYWQQTGGHPPNPPAEYRLSRSSVPRVPRR